MDAYRTKIELFRIIDAMPASMLEDLYESLKTKAQTLQEPMSEWQRKDIKNGLKDLDEGRKMEFDDFIATL